MMLSKSITHYLLYLSKWHTSFEETTNSCVLGIDSAYVLTPAYSLSPKKVYT